MKVGDLVRNKEGEHFLVVQRYKVYNYTGPNRWADSLYCQSTKTGKIESLRVSDLEVISESR